MLDPSRNGTGATIVAPYSPRARPDGTVSFPVSPDELGSIEPGAFTLATALDRLDGPGPALWDRAAGVVASGSLPSSRPRTSPRRE